MNEEATEVLENLSNDFDGIIFTISKIESRTRDLYKFSFSKDENKQDEVVYDFKISIDKNIRYQNIKEMVQKRIELFEEPIEEIK